MKIKPSPHMKYNSREEQRLSPLPFARSTTEPSAKHIAERFQDLFCGMLFLLLVRYVSEQDPNQCIHALHLLPCFRCLYYTLSRRNSQGARRAVEIFRVLRPAKNTTACPFTVSEQRSTMRNREERKPRTTHPAYKLLFARPLSVSGAPYMGGT